MDARKDTAYLWKSSENFPEIPRFRLENFPKPRNSEISETQKMTVFEKSAHFKKRVL
jgi:hypothetical protein